MIFRHAFVLGETVGGVITMASILAFSHPDALLAIGNGAYQIFAKGEKFEFTDDDIKNSKEKLNETIVQLTDLISEKISNPPSKTGNMLSYGGLNARYYKEIAEIAEVRARLHYDLVNISFAKQKLNCI
jgi:hypothetical protein